MSVLSVSTSPTHTFYKCPTQYIYLLTSLGVQNDAHCTSSNTTPENPRQVHLISSEFLSSLAKPSSKYSSYQLSPGSLGENITTQGIDLLELREGSRLYFGKEGAVVTVTGWREPWKRVGEWPEGLLDRVRAKDGKGCARVGVYGVVEREGYVQVGDGVKVERGKGRGLRSV